MNVDVSAMRSNASDLIDRAKNARSEANYFDSINLPETAERLRQEAEDYDAQAANIVYELAGFGAD